MDELISNSVVLKSLFKSCGNISPADAILRKLEAYEYDDTELIYEESDECEDGLYIILDGTCNITDKNGVYLYSVHKGDFFGDSEFLFDLDRRAETVKAKGSVVVAALSKDDYKNLKESDPEAAVYLSSCLLNRRSLDIKNERISNIHKSLGFRDLMLTFILFFFISFYSDALSLFASGSGLSSGSIIIYFIFIALLITGWFTFSRIRGKDLGFGGYNTWLENVMNIAVVIELCAVFYLASSLASSGIAEFLVSSSELSGSSYFVFIGLLIYYTCIFIICVGSLPTAMKSIVSGKFGIFLSYIIPALFAAAVFSAIGGIVSAIWLGITALSLTFVRIRTGRIVIPCLSWIAVISIGTFFFNIPFIPLIYYL